MAEIIVKSKLREIKGKYYAQLSWKLNGVHNSTCLATGISVSGTDDSSKLTESKKRKAEKVAYEAAIRKMEELRQQKITELEHEMSLYFRDCAECWLSDCRAKNLRTTTVVGYEYAVRSKLIPYFEGEKFKDKKIADITREDIEEYYRFLAASGKSRNTIKHYNAYLSSIFKIALKRGHIKESPTSGISFTHISEFQGKAFELDQIELILSKVLGTKLYLPIMLSLFCGLRRSEVLGLCWDAVDLDTGVLSVIATRSNVANSKLEFKTKSMSGRRLLPIPDQLKSALISNKKLQEANKQFFGDVYGHGCEYDYVVVDESGKPLSSETVSKGFKAVLDSLGLEGYSFHSLRHTYGTFLAAAKVEPFTLKAMMGHSSIQTSNIYIHPNYQSKLVAVKALENMYAGV